MKNLIYSVENSFCYLVDKSVSDNFEINMNNINNILIKNNKRVKCVYHVMRKPLKSFYLYEKTQSKIYENTVLWTSYDKNLFKVIDDIELANMILNNEINTTTR